MIRQVPGDGREHVVCDPHAAPGATTFILLALRGNESPLRKRLLDLTLEILR